MKAKEYYEQIIAKNPQTADEIDGLIPGDEIDENVEIKRYYIVPEEISGIFEKVFKDA